MRKGQVFVPEKGCKSLSFHAENCINYTINMNIQEIDLYSMLICDIICTIKLTAAEGGVFI